MFQHLFLTSIIYISSLVHTQNQSMAAGTAFAISYKVAFSFTPFSVLFFCSLYLVKYQGCDTRKPCCFLRPPSVRTSFKSDFYKLFKLLLPRSTPWKRVTTYDVPAAMPPCPKGGCICAVSVFSPRPFCVYFKTDILLFLLVGMGMLVLLV